MFRSRKRRRIVLSVSLLATVLTPQYIKAQLVDGDDGVTFADRYSINRAPTFTRPEVLDLLSRLGPAPSPNTLTVEHDAPGFEPRGPLSRIILAEPKGPAKVLVDLMNTPVAELLIPRAEAEPEVSPRAGEVPSAQATGTATVAAREAQPMAERPSGSDVATLLNAPPPDKGTLTTVETSGAPEQPAASTVPRASEPQVSAPMTTAPTTPKVGRRLATGRAAWYQHPGRTASGERFNPNQLTAAHRSLPFGTKVRVVNPNTGRSVVVRINDRIPKKTKKIVIDLSRASAAAIGLTSVGTVALYRLDRT